MIDIHTHVLPGIDDGAEDLDEALAMCRLAAEGGCEAVIATPHQRTPAWENTDPAALEALRRLVAGETGGHPAVHAGGEIRIDSTLLDELERHPESGLQPLAGSRYLLLEFSRREPLVDPAALTHELIVGGWRPIYAHPEMISFLAADLGLVERLAELGAMFQITAMSVTGDAGTRAQAVCDHMIERGLVHFVASDAHGRDRRPPDLHRARRRIAERWGEDLAERLTEGNPRRVLADVPLATPVAAPAGG
jgi:protein-tyrosine phosphatase